MSKLIPVNELLASITKGDQVTILVPNGRGRNGQEWKEKTGRCVFAPGHQSGGTHATLNMGGQYGTPGIATERNLVRVGQRIAFYDSEQNQNRCDTDSDTL
ncbi:MAG: hypothetical protein KIT88_10160 [Phycisphaeraceae bacterium]|nr:hypothetical protein [Phycisphaeraceae bacterium]